MKNYYKILSFITVSFLFVSCVADRVYTSASYGGMKKYTEKPLYNNKNTSAIYLSGGVKTGNRPQEGLKDEVIAGDFFIHRATATKYFNFYYGLGATFGNYKINDSYISPSNGVPYFQESEKLDYYNFNIKTGFNFIKNLKKVELNIIGLELIYFKESGEYIDRLGVIPRVKSIDIMDKREIVTFNITTGAIFKINDNNNFGAGVFLGDSFLSNKSESIFRFEAGTYLGGYLKYNYKRFTASFIYEESNFGIRTSSFGLTCRVLDK